MFGWREWEIKKDPMFDGGNDDSRKEHGFG
jgi:hypothetical protein